MAPRTKWPSSRRQPTPADGHARKYDDVNNIISPEIENPTPSRLLKSQPGQFAIASIEDRMSKKQQRPDSLPGKREEKRGPQISQWQPKQW